MFATARNDTIRMEGIATGSLIASSANGDVLFSEVEVAEHIILLAGNGNIRGELPGEMRDYHIESETDNGDNNLPAMLDGEGIFLRVINDNGDICLLYTSRLLENDGAELTRIREAQQKYRRFDNAKRIAEAARDLALQR